MELDSLFKIFRYFGYGIIGILYLAAFIFLIVFGI